MIKLTLEEYRAALTAQQVPPEFMAVVCPMCGTVQNSLDLINAGVGKDMNDVEKYIGFSCIGRWTGGKPPRRTPDGKPCDWTLGGLFSCHKMEIDHEGKTYPHFEVATPQQAQKHMSELEHSR